MTTIKVDFFLNSYSDSRWLVCYAAQGNVFVYCAEASESEAKAKAKQVGGFVVFHHEAQ